MELRLLRYFLAVAKEQSITGATEILHVTQPTLSHHMRVLCDCGLVCVRREGKWSHYSLCCETFSAFKDFIGKLECCKNEKGGCDCG